MTLKLSGSHINVSTGLTCIRDRIVTTFIKNKLKVFGINKIEVETYPEEFDKSFNITPTSILYEIHHTYRCYNDLTEEPPFDTGKFVVFTDFVEMVAAEAKSTNNIPILEDKSDPKSWVSRPSGLLNGSALIVKSTTTSTIVKLQTAGVEPSILGYMEYPYPYVMRSKPVLECITEPDPIIPNVTLNLETLEIAWQPNETYTIEVTDGFVNHEFGMNYSNPSFSEPFATNQPPYMVSWEPSNAPETGHIEFAKLKYVRRIKKGEQSIKLYKSPSTLVKTYLPTDPEVQIVNGVINGYEGAIIVSIDVRDYLESNQEYYIHVEQGALYDYDFFANAAITDNSTITFTASMPNYIDWLPGPVTKTRNNRSVKIIYPYTAVPNPESTGTIRFYDGDDNLLRTFQPTGSDVMYEPTSPALSEYPYSTTITFDVLGLLKEDSTYYMVIDEGVFQDVDNFNNISVLDINELRYSTDDLVFPGLRSSLDILFDLNANNLRPRTFLINAQATASTHINAMMVRLGVGHLYSEASVFSNARYLATLYNFTNKTYVANYQNYLFTSSIIRDHDVGASYTLTFSSPNGKFGTILGSVTNYSITGTLSEINTILPNVVFWPTKNYTGSTNYTVSLSRDGDFMQSTNKLLTRSSTYTGETYTFTSNSSWSPSPADIEYNAVMDYLVVGAGGRGGVSIIAGPSNPYLGTGGGGAGEVNYVAGISVENKSYAVEVGAIQTWTQAEIFERTSIDPAGIITSGRVNNWYDLIDWWKAPSGLPSSFNGTTSSGGEGGQGTWGWAYYPRGNELTSLGDLPSDLRSRFYIPEDGVYIPWPNGGSNESFAGGQGTMTSNTTYKGDGGGGAGAGGAGQNATSSPSHSGYGGVPVANSISGTSVDYGYGGQGFSPTTNTTRTLRSTYGSGGCAQWGDDLTYGQNGTSGVVIVRVRIQ